MGNVAQSIGLRILQWLYFDTTFGVFLAMDGSLRSEARSRRIFEAPKSGKGWSVRLTQRALSALRKHRKRQLEEWMKLPLGFPSAGCTLLNFAGRLPPARQASYLPLITEELTLTRHQLYLWGVVGQHSAEPVGPCSNYGTTRKSSCATTSSASLTPRA